MLNVTNARQTTLDFHRQVVGRFTKQLKTNIFNYIFWIPVLCNSTSSSAPCELQFSGAPFSGLASVLLKELTPVIHSVMRRGSARAKEMSSVPNVHSVRQASMDWRVQTHMDVNSASVMDTAVYVRQPWVIRGITFQHQVWKVGRLSMSKVQCACYNFTNIGQHVFTGVQNFLS